LEWLWARDDAELESFAIDEQGSMAALNWNVAGESELAFYDLRSSKRKSLPKLPGEIAGGLTFSRDGRLLAVTLSGAARPTDIWTVNVSTGAMTQATQSPHAGVDLKSLVRPELRRFAAHDGLQLSGWLYLPATGKAPFPMVFWFHGGPESEERPRFNSLYQAMLAGGMAIFAPNVRGSTGFGKRFVNLDNGALRFDGIRDIKSCVAYVVQQGLADEKRIGIMGASYGGYMTMAGLTEYPELFAAGADLFGVVNFETFFKHTEPWMASISKTEYGDPEREADLLRRLSPIHKLDRVVAPTLVIHGANDTNVPVEEADQVVDNLKKRNIPVEYLLFPDEGHGIRKTSNRIRAITAIVRWFDKYLKGAVGRSDH
jgi:dipeptidyl aminopeptidase/acylaminoacyl peptidase